MNIDLTEVPVQWLGVVDYEEALQKQMQAADLVRQDDASKGAILACEHPAVITLGRRAQPLNDVLASMEQLRKDNIKIVGTDRGGQATLHNEKQLVVYPILPLRRLGMGVRGFVECLERATAMFLAEYGIEVTRGYEPGLFAEGRKIAAFGIRVDRGVSMHGLAINIANDLTQFTLIKQCGMSVQATNLETEMRSFTGNIPAWDFESLAKQWTRAFVNEVLTYEREPVLGVALAPPASESETPPTETNL